MCLIFVLSCILPIKWKSNKYFCVSHGPHEDKRGSCFWGLLFWKMLLQQGSINNKLRNRSVLLSGRSVNKMKHPVSTLKHHVLNKRKEEILLASGMVSAFLHGSASTDSLPGLDIPGDKGLKVIGSHWPWVWLAGKSRRIKWLLFC